MSVDKVFSPQRFNDLPSGINAKVPAETAEKFKNLERNLAEKARDGLVVAFSGGVDSAFLLWAACRAAKEVGGGRVLALTAVSASMAQAERDDARAFSAWLGAEHVWQESLEVEKPEYAANDADRCYHCKSELFRIALDVAERLGCRWLAYGYNASDRGDVRPGHRAALENHVLSPLAEAGLTKDELRILMRAHALPLSEKPASPCLSSRIMHGTAVTPARLADIEALEALLRLGGLRVFRVRLHELGAQSLLRLETDPAELELALKLREPFVAEARRRGYRWTTLDLGGYRMGGGTGHE